MDTAYFSDIRKSIIGEIRNAKSSIKIAVCWFTNHDLFNALIEKLQQGLLIEVIILNDFINNREDGLNFQSFVDQKGNFYFGDNDKPMHNKYCIIDNRILINGSYNWTYYAENKNEENIIVHKTNPQIVEQFINDFERIKSGLKIVKEIQKHVIAEIPDFNVFGSYNYLAQDYLYQALETKNPSIVERAFKLSPDNIQIQKKAVEFNLQVKRRTKFSIGEDVKDNGYTVLIPKGTEIPYIGSQSFTTTVDNQITTNVTIRYGEDVDCRKNITIGTFDIGGIPLMKAGEPKLVTQVSVNIYGQLLVTEIIKDTNHRVSRTFDIKNILD